MIRPFGAALLLALISSSSQADEVDPTPVGSLAQIQARGRLRWGIDPLGGAPYAFQSPTDPNVLTGFEVELADALAKRLGVKMAPTTGPWDRLLELLNRGDFDIAMNGLEIADEKKRVCLMSKPYFVASAKLTIRKGDVKAPRTMEELNGRAVGTLPGALTERILKRAGAIVKTYDGGQNEIYDDLKIGRIDAVLMDDPVAHYFGDIEPAFETLPQSFGEVSYGVAVRPGDEELLSAINGALDELNRNGTLRRIYERWGIWNATTAKLLGQDPTPQSAISEAFETWRAAVGALPPFHERLVTRYPALFGTFAKAAGLTLLLSILSMLFAVLLGVTLAVIRVFGARPLQLISLAYVEFFRGTPLLIQLTMIYFGLPELGVTLNPFVAGCLALGMNYAAAEAENYRSGISSIPAGQLDAARVLGLTRWQALRHVVAPQAIRVSLPPMTNDFIALLKDSSLVSLVTLTELTKTYSSLANATRDHLGLGVVVAVWYLIIGLPFARLARSMEDRLGRHLRRVTA
jgi:polar amino acid transport system substrate-binding protein